MDQGWGGITADELRAAWDGRLRPVPDDLIATGVSPATRRLLSQVGLPTAEVLGIAFVFDRRLSKVERQQGREWLVVTEAMPFMAYAVDLRTDQVVEFDYRDPQRSRFVNSDLATLIFYLGRVGGAMSHDDLPTVRAALADVRASLSTFDPAALEEGAPWWYLLDELDASVAS